MQIYEDGSKKLKDKCYIAHYVIFKMKILTLIT